MSEDAKTPVGGSRAPVDSASAFARACLELAQMAEREGVRDILWVDIDFAIWPLSDAQFLESLTSWMRGAAGRRLTLVASSYDLAQQLHPRLIRWRQTWSHVVECRLIDDVAPSDLVTTWAMAGAGLILLERDTFQGRWLLGSVERQSAWERAQSWRSRAYVVQPGSVAGL